MTEWIDPSFNSRIVSIDMSAWTEQGDTWVCEHGTACDVHCCNCHSGFNFPGMIHSNDCPEDVPA